MMRNSDGNREDRADAGECNEIWDLGPQLRSFTTPKQWGFDSSTYLESRRMLHVTLEYRHDLNGSYNYPEWFL
jgi:hypothetical protein